MKVVYAGLIMKNTNNSMKRVVVLFIFPPHPFCTIFFQPYLIVSSRPRISTNSLTHWYVQIIEQNKLNVFHIEKIWLFTSTSINFRIIDQMDKELHKRTLDLQIDVIIHQLDWPFW